MATRVLGPTGSRRRRRFLFVSLLLIAAAALLFVGAAQAVHDETFQLDGDALASTTTNICSVGETPPCHAQSFDWDSFFDSAGAKSPVLPDASRPGYTASGFQRDFNTGNNGTTYVTNDATTFTQGSKDINNISSNWVCTPANNVTNKGDIQNAYAVAYTDPVTQQQFLYFAQERNSNVGDANVGFWFLQDNANCPSGGGAWTGNHVDGDLFIVSAFTNGGSVSTITAYKWVGGASGHIDPTPVAGGGDCRASTQTAGDPICATANTTNITVPWLTDNNGKTTGLGHSLLAGEFFEGGINLSNAGLAGKCFNVFVGNTRSSQSLTATLYDFARGSLGECTSTTATTPVDAADHTKGPATSIPVDPADARVDVQDKTVLTVTGASSFSGSIDWHICGPTDASSTQLCDGTTGNVGVDLGSQNITAGGTYYSPTATVTAAGRYCFRAEFSGDSSVGVPSSSDSRATECFTVAPQQPSLTTAATTGPVDFGQPISDTVTLSGTAHKPGSGGPTGSDGSINPTSFGGDASGNIVVTAYGPDSCSTAAFTSNPIAASGDGSYGGAGTAFEFTPSSPGQYIFVASYAGDPPNTKNIAASACSAAPDAEKVTVRQIPTEIATAQKVYPNDSATITSSVAGNLLPSGGTVVFRLYGPTAGSTAAQNCALHGDTIGSGGLLYRQTNSNVGGTHSATTATSNTTVAVDASDTYYWRVTYAPGDTAHLGSQSDCVENTAVTFTNDSGPGSLFP
jgi:hypothetical protein